MALRRPVAKKVEAGSSSFLSWPSLRAVYTPRGAHGLELHERLKTKTPVNVLVQIAIAVLDA